MSSFAISSSVRRIATGLAVLGFSAGLMTACDDSTKGPSTEDPTLYTSKQLLIDTGTVLFETCAGCHGEGGNGQGHGGPVLANSDYVMGSKARLIKTVLHGVTDTIYVNGKMYLPGGSMPAWEAELSNHEVAGILTYIRAVLNDSLVSDCVPVPPDSIAFTCTRTARDSADIANDSVAVWEVKAVRDSIGPAPQQ